MLSFLLYKRHCRENGSRIRRFKSRHIKVYYLYAIDFMFELDLKIKEIKVKIL
jgi:hypothetical protein